MLRMDSNIFFFITRPGVRSLRHPESSFTHTSNVLKPASAVTIATQRRKQAGRNQTPTNPTPKTQTPNAALSPCQAITPPATHSQPCSTSQSTSYHNNSPSYQTGFAVQTPSVSQSVITLNQHTSLTSVQHPQTPSNRAYAARPQSTQHDLHSRHASVPNGFTAPKMREPA